MHSLPEKTDQDYSYDALEFLVKAGSFFLVGPLALIVSAYLYVWLKESRNSMHKALFFGNVLISLFWLRIAHPFYGELYAQKLFHNPIGVMLVTWLMAIPLIPLGALAMGLITWLLDYFRPKTMADWERAEQEILEGDEEKGSQEADKRVHNPPQRASDIILLGPHIKNQIPPDHIGIRKAGSWIGLEDPLLNQHLFILGATGSGKSTTLKRIAWEVLQKTDRDLFVVDGKGDPEFAEELRSLIWTARKYNAPIFRLGLEKSGAKYHGFQGNKEAIYNRLASMIGVHTAEGGAEYYADRNRDFLQLVSYAPEGPPRSFQEVRQRLKKDWLINAWKAVPEELDVVNSFSKEDYASIQSRIRPLARVFQEVIDPSGFSLEETRAAVFSIRAQSARDTAGRFLEFFIEDLKDFVGNRQQRPALLIIDEFAVFENTSIIDLLRLSRGAKLGIILATQDIAGLGDKDTRISLISSTVTKIQMFNDFPEELAMLAGTKKRVEASVQYDETGVTGRGSGRLQDVFGIDMNEAARLRTGEAFIFKQRYPVKLKFAPVYLDEIQEAPPEATGEAKSKEALTPSLIQQGQAEELVEDSGIEFEDFIAREDGE